MSIVVTQFLEQELVTVTIFDFVLKKSELEKVSMQRNVASASIVLIPVRHFQTQIGRVQVEVGDSVEVRHVPDAQLGGLPAVDDACASGT